MGKTTGFLEYNREDRAFASVKDRTTNFREFVKPLSSENLNKQASRCMDCGVPYCHSGCPVNNIIPDWNDLVFRKNFK